jgi:hypothetical protein
MEPIAVFLLLIILALILLFVTRPFFERWRARPAQDSHELSSLLAERERVLTTLQELDFDQALGKIPAEDYPAQRTTLLKKGADVLRQLDALTPVITGQAGRKIYQTEGASQSTASLSDDDLEDLLAKRRYDHTDKTAGFCPKCGKPVLRSDIFCPLCGSSLKLF